MRKYDDEYKREAVKKVHESQSVASVSRELGVAESLLHKWKREAIETSSDAEKEVIALPKKLREVEMERDILKTCIAPPPESTAKRIVSAQGGTDAANVSGFFFVKAPAFEP